MLLEFTLFPKMPLELRNMVCGFAARVPRGVPPFDYEYRTSENEKAIKAHAKLPGQRDVPALVHVSQEARAEGLKYYGKCFNEYHMPLYINFGIDFIVFNEFRAGGYNGSHHDIDLDLINLPGVTIKRLQDVSIEGVTRNHVFGLLRALDTLLEQDFIKALTIIIDGNLAYCRRASTSLRHYILLQGEDTLRGELCRVQLEREIRISRMNLDEDAKDLPIKFSWRASEVESPA